MLVSIYRLTSDPECRESLVLYKRPAWTESEKLNVGSGVRRELEQLLIGCASRGVFFNILIVNRALELWACVSQCSQSETGRHDIKPQRTGEWFLQPIFRSRIFSIRTNLCQGPEIQAQFQTAVAIEPKKGTRLASTIRMLRISTIHDNQSFQIGVYLCSRPWSFAKSYEKFLTNKGSGYQSSEVFFGLAFYGRHSIATQMKEC